MSGFGVVNKSKSELTKEELRKLFPNKAKTITDETVELINSANNDPEFNGDEFINTMTDYAGAMAKHGASMKEYIRALKFCAYLEATDDSYTEAYMKARSEDQFVRNAVDVGKGSEEWNAMIAAASRYRKTPLVRDILTAADMPLHLMFQSARYKMVGVLMDEAQNAPYSKDRINAADRFLTHVKPPENMKVELDVGVKEDSAVQDLQEQLAVMAAKQKHMLTEGAADLNSFGSMKPKSSDVIDAEVDGGN